MGGIPTLKKTEPAGLEREGHHGAGGGYVVKPERKDEMKWLRTPMLFQTYLGVAIHE
jgi:predicted DNA-binding transcriptional regulator YafY